MTAITPQKKPERRSNKPSARLSVYLPQLLMDWLADAPDDRYREIEGTVAFVDISGFTAMSERLARRGKEGAEELLDVLNNVFSELLDLARQDGGGLVKFGGDALLLFFSGERHQALACHAAAAMRAALRTSGRVRTSSGLVRLRMSIGIHTGVFHFFLVGDRHRELVVTGLAHTHTVEMEGTAEAGEILLSEDTARALPPRCLGQRKGDGILLRQRPSRQQAQPPARPRAMRDVRDYVPEILRAYLAKGSGSAEHRQVTIAFIHFTGADSVLQLHGPSELHRRLEGFLGAVQEAAARYKVAFLSTDVAKDGGKIILTAGAPLSTGADEEAVLQAVRMIADGDYGLDLSIGVNRGRIFSGEIGPEFRRTYTIIGDAVNLAARVMARAAHGEVLATPDVLDRSAVTFDAVALEPFMVKGKSQPVTAYRIGRRTGRRERYEASDLPFIGRDAEFARLEAAARDARQGRGRLLQIVGDAGIGKSRLVGELSELCTDMSRITVGAELYESTTPYFIFRRLLCDLLDVSGDEPPALIADALARSVERLAPALTPVVPLLGTLLEIPLADTDATRHLTGEYRRARLHDAVADLLVELLPRPTLIVLEDLHWLDDASAELLAALVGRIGSRPWLICATTRPPGRNFKGEDGSVTTIALRALDDSAMKEIARVASEALAIPPQHLSIAVKRAGGSPLFLRELLAASATASAEDDTLPERLESLISARIDRLDPGERRLLRLASVFGATTSLDMMKEVSGEVTGLPRSLSGFLEEENGVLRFRHALFRDAAYEGLPFRERRTLHESIGSAFERRLGKRVDDNAEILSLHFYRARNMEKSWHYAIVAGDQARRQFANLEAAQFYERALDAGRRMKVDTAELCKIAEALGDVYELAGRFQNASGAYRTARALSPTLSAMAGLIQKEGIVCERSSRYSAALRWYSRGQKLLDGLATPQETRTARVRLGNAVAATRFRQGRFRDCTRVGLDTLPDAELVEDRGLLAHTLFLLGAAETYLKSLAKNPYLERALPIYEALNDFVGQANVLNNMGVDAYYEGRWDEARQCYERSRTAREAVGDVVGAATASNNIGEILSDQGRIHDAEKLFREALTVWKATAYPVGVALATSNLGRLSARSGNSEEAARLLTEALAGFRSIGARTFIFDTQSKIAENLVFAQQTDDAQVLVDQLIQETTGIPGTFAIRAMLYRLRAYVLLQRGDGEAAAIALQQSLRIAQEAGADFEAALTLEALSHAASQLRNRDQAAHLLEAQKIFLRLGVVLTPRVPLPPISDRIEPAWLPEPGSATLGNIPAV
jgi:class 3 adenylate cyclase/tetratricopeptide (TPR) repeat protein